MLRKRHAFYLVLVAALAGVVAGLPASAHAHHARIPCMGAPDFVGHMGDGEGWFRYPAGRSAEHVNAGTFTLAIDDTSSTQNFRLRDLTWGGTHVDRATSGPGQSEECWTVTLEVGDYEWISDFDQTGYLRGLVTAHPNPNPPPPPPAEPRRPAAPAAASGATRPDPDRRPRPADRRLLRGRQAGHEPATGDVHDPGPRSLRHAQLPPDRAGRRREDLGRRHRASRLAADASRRQVHVQV